MKRVFIFLLFAALTCAGAFAGGKQEAATAAGAKKAFAGTKLVFACLDTTNYKKMDNLLPWLEAKTGINVTMDYIPENAYMTKLQVVLSSKTGEYDVIYANNKMYPVLFPSGWILALDDYLKDASLTSADYNYADFVPKIAQNVMYNGKVMGIPFGNESNILYYNKTMFKDAGYTTPPKTMADVYEYAKKLNQPDKGHAGIAMLGTREGNVNGYGWIMLWLSLGGTWTPANGPKYAVLANPEAIKATELWTDMLTNYAPKGISNFGWNELYLSMQQQKVAMVIATTKDYPIFVDPTKSKIGAELGYACIQGTGDSYTVGNIGAWLVPSSGKNLKAAWTALQVMTNKDAQTKQVQEKDLVDVTRQSVIDSQVFGSKYNPEWAAASKEAFAHGNVEYTPLIPQGGQIREYLAIALSKCLSGQATPKEAMEEANANVVKLLTAN
jgi:multiple sugar transport system substrate-binding protein